MTNRQNKKNLFGNKYVNIINGSLCLDHFQVSDIGARYGTPSFIFLLDKVKDNIQKISTVFSAIFPESQGFYSVKSNYLDPILKTVKETSFGAEIISLFELQKLQAVDFPMKRVIAGGPYLPESALEAFIEARVEYLVVYSIADLRLVASVLEDNSKITSQKILLRFQAPKYSARHGIPLTIDKIVELDKIFRDSPKLSFEGILSHMGTRMRALVNYQQNFSHILQILALIRDHSSLVPLVINMGGGFPNADAIKTHQLRHILEVFKFQLDQAGWHSIRLFCEPGRFIVGDVGFCLARVFRIDPTSHTIFLNVGNNLIPKFMKSALRFYNVSKIIDKPNMAWDFMGNIPSDQDILVKNFNTVDTVEKSDLYLIANVGAYSLTWSTRFPYHFPNILFIAQHSLISDKFDPFS